MSCLRNEAVVALAERKAPAVERAAPRHGWLEGVCAKVPKIWRSGANGSRSQAPGMQGQPVKILKLFSGVGRGASGPVFRLQMRSEGGNPSRIAHLGEVRKSLGNSWISI